MRASSGNAAEKLNRQADRVLGPFTGRRLGALSVPIKIHDLSRTGCLVESWHEVAPGRRMRLEIDLPFAGTVTLEAESVYTRSDYGFAVKFVHVTDENAAALDAAVMRLRTWSPLE